jgi:hypothetical protein
MTISVAYSSCKKLHHGTQRMLYLDLVQNQQNVLHTHTFCLPNNHFNIIPIIISWSGTIHTIPSYMSNFFLSTVLSPKCKLGSNYDISFMLHISLPTVFIIMTINTYLQISGSKLTLLVAEYQVTNEAQT